MTLLAGQQRSARYELYSADAEKLFLCAADLMRKLGPNEVLRDVSVDAHVTRFLTQGERTARTAVRYTMELEIGH